MSCWLQKKGRETLGGVRNKCMNSAAPRDNVTQPITFVTVQFKYKRKLKKFSSFCDDPSDGAVFLHPFPMSPHRSLMV